MRFQFIHAADLHIDSPFGALGAKNEEVAKTFRTAGRRAVEALIDWTIEDGAKFLIVAGDVFDGDWSDFATGLFFAQQLGKLDRAGVRTFLVRGNHDAANRMSRKLEYPPSVHEFDTRRAQSRLIEDLQVALHGRSFPDREAPADFLSSYPPARKDWLNIGLLHTSLEGAPGHNPYAPCTVADLVRFGYDYWALGHVHAARVVNENPWIVYPGNIQGRNPKETGPKGAVRVTVEDGRIVAVEPFALDAARWAQAQADVSGLEDDEAIMQAIADALTRAHAGADGRPLAVRLTLTGRTPAHARLVAQVQGVDEQWRGEAQNLAYRLAQDCWIEKIRLETRAPPAPVALDPEALDAAGLLAATLEDPEFLAEIAALARSLADRAPHGVVETLTTRPPAEWAARARDLLLSPRA